MQSRIISLGESVVDILPAAGGLWRPVPGGSSYNFALALGRLGAPCAFAGRLSSDEQGERMAAILLAAGVDLDLCERDERPSPLALVKTGAEGPAFEIYLDGTAHAPPALEPGWLDDAAHLHVSSFSAVSGAWGEAVLAALLSARGRVSASLDVNIRPRLVPPRETTLAEIEMRIALVDVIKASDADLAWLRPDQAPLTTAREWARRFDCPVLLTLGRPAPSPVCRTRRSRRREYRSKSSIRSAPAIASSRPFWPRRSRPAIWPRNCETSGWSEAG